MSTYDAFAGHYDTWAPPDAGDIAFYVAQAQASGGPVVELGVGTGRVAIPIAQAGVHVIGVDASQEMLDVCRRRAESAGVSDRIDLRHGDFRSPPVSEAVPLVTCPFRSLLHLESDEDRAAALSAIHGMLAPGGRFVFDVVAPQRDGAATSTDWIQRTPEVREKDEFDWEQRTINVTLEAHGRETKLRFAWITREEWRDLFHACGFEVYACYGWFDLSPCAAGAHSVWVVTPAAP